jgi:AcrR family transcriptional regulator
MPPDERRAAIVEATLPLVLRDGPSVSTRQIAEAAGVAEGTIFRVFPDKDALMRAVLERGFDPRDAMAALAAVDRSLPLRERLVTVVEIVQERLRGAFGLLGALGLHRSPRPPEGWDAHRRDEANEAFRAAIADVVAGDGESLRVPPAEFAHALRLLTFSATHPLICEGRPMTAEAIVDVLLVGMAARTNPTPGSPTPDADPAGTPVASHHARTIEV